VGKYCDTKEEKHETVGKGRLRSLRLEVKAEEVGKLVQMADRFRQRRSYKELEARIKRLKKAEKELLQLDPPQVFSVELNSIRPKLKSPSRVEEAEQELDALKQKVSQYRASLEAAGIPLETGALPQLEHYSVDKKIGQGGFANVYLGRNAQGVAVALKMPRLAQYETIDAKDFINEAELWSKLSRLRHPNIVELYEYGTEPYPWIAMEYMEGGSLKLQVGRLECKACLEIAMKLMEALHFAHHHGVVHRDVKPENVLFNDRGIPKLTDWGLAKVLLDASGASGGFRGTVAYSAPEQLASSRFGTIDWRTDIYQMGMLVYELLVGQLPFAGLEPAVAITSILNDLPPVPSHLNGKISTQLDGTVLKAIAKHKEERFQTMDTFKDKLKEVSDGL
jgi:serine/threonine protein kinase